jgi:RHS repeat-associated protein
LVTAGNSWSATFEPMTAGRGVGISTPDGPVRFWAEGAVAVAPTVEPNGTSVRYRNVMPGADLVYQVTGAGVEELLILKSASATPQVSFAVDGAEFDVEPAGLSAKNGRVRISRPESFTDVGRVIDPARHVFTVANRRAAVPGTARITVGLDPTWVKARPSSEFPITVDPSVVVNTGATTLRSYANYTNNGVSYATYEDGYARVGNPYLSSTSTVRWRSVVNFPHGPYIWANVVDASLTTTESGSGGSGTQDFNVYWADQWGFHYGATPRYYETTAVTSNQVYGWLPYIASSISTGTASHSGNLKYLYNGWTRRGLTTGALLLTGNEASAYTFKKFTVTLSMTVNRWPNTFTGSVSGAYLVPTLTRPTVTDPDNDALTFRYSVYNTNGTVYANSGWITGSSWTAPKVPSTWHGQAHDVKIEAYDGITFNGETHIREWNGTWTATDRAPNAAALTTPANGASTHDLTPTLSANTATDPDGDTVQYRFYTCTATPCGTKTYQPNSTWRTATPWTATPTANIGTYGTTRWWGVETYDGQLTTSTALRGLNLVNANASAAALTAPADGAAPHSLSHTFTANTATDPDGDSVQHRFFYCTDAPCASRTYMTPWSTTAPWTKTFTFPASMWGTTLKWGVETTDAYQTTPTTTALRTLTLANSPPVISGLSPANNANATGRPPTLSASLADPDGDIVNYRFIVSPSTGIGMIAASPWTAGSGTVQWDVPADLMSDAEYRWRIEATDELGAESASIDRFVTQQGRLGPGGVSPHQQVGPLSVNLATGNVFFSTGLGPAINTAGGPLSVGLSYNSNDRSNEGLTAEYYVEDTSPGHSPGPDFDEIVLQRVDRLPVFDWSDRSPAPSVPADGFRVRWTGFMRVPNVAGDWQFAGGHAGPLEITVDGNVAYSSTGTVSLDDPNGFAGSTPVAGISGQIVPVQIDYTAQTGDAFAGFRAQNGSLEYQVEQSWFTQTRPVLPAGWTLGFDTGLDPVWLSATITENEIALSGPDGEPVVFRRDEGGAFLSPDEVEDTVAVNADGTITVHADDNNLYRFNTAGQLIEVTTAADAWQPAGGRLVYPGTAPHVLTRIEDHLDATRSIELRYQRPGTTCPDSTAPAGMLCEVVHHPVGLSTRLYYDAGLLVRISEPGDEQPNPAPEGRADTTFVWTAGRLTSLTDIINNDRADAEAGGTIPVGERIGATDLDTEISWTATGKPQSVTSPRATVGQPRATTTFSWNPTSTAITQSGIGGTARTVTYDATGRALTDTDAVGRAATVTWAESDIDLPVAVTSGGRVSTTVYSAEWNVTDRYGPAPTSSCFNSSQLIPTGACTASTPHTHIDYDHNLTGLTGLAWSDPGFIGTPAGRGAAPAGDLNYQWPGTSAPAGVANGDNWSARYTGILTPPSAGLYALRVQTGTTDTATVSIDGIEIATAAGQGTPGDATVTGIQLDPTNQVNLAIDFEAGTGTSSLTVSWTPPGGSQSIIPATALKPGFGYPTRVTTTDIGASTPSLVTETRYHAAGVDPALGLVTAEIDDPDGLALATTFAYEPATSGSLLRQNRMTLPAFETNPTAANSTSYGYYGSTEAIDNPCTPAFDPASQAGLQRTLTYPAPAIGNAVQIETIYDALGRPAATRYGGETTWTCSTSDTRGRTISVSHPPDAQNPSGRSVTNTYAVDGNPYKVSVNDSTGTVSTTIDGVGRPVMSTDVWGLSTTTVYDLAGRPTSTESAAGMFGAVYDDAGRTLSKTLDGQTLATMTYTPDTATLDPGVLSAVTYPAGQGNAGNGTTGSITYDPSGRVAQLAWRRVADGALITSDAVTRSVTGRVVSTTVDGTATPAWHYSYDGAGRLARATGSGRDLQYAFAPMGGCGANAAAGANTNRTSLHDGGSLVATYCYDHADRLTSTTQPGFTGTIVHDTRGNLVQIGGDTHKYDSANRHVGIAQSGVRDVAFLRDALDRIVQRTDTDLASTTATSLRYSYGDAADSADLTTDAQGAVVEATIALPGGALLTRRATGSVWSYPNVHGDLVATADYVGTKQGPTIGYDPYGAPSNEIPDNQTSTGDYGWVGQHRRRTEHGPGAEPVISMGARPYSPLLGRFLSADPVLAGSANPYEYSAADPINNLDLDGRKVVGHATSSWSAIKSDLFSNLSVCAFLVCWKHLGYQTATFSVWTKVDVYHMVFRFVVRRSAYEVSTGVGYGPFSMDRGPRKRMHDYLGWLSLHSFYTVGPIGRPSRTRADSFEQGFREAFAFVQIGWIVCPKCS